MIVSELIPVADATNNPCLQPGCFLSNKRRIGEGWPFLHQFCWARKKNAANIWVPVISRTLFLCSLGNEVGGFVPDYHENYVGVDIRRNVVAEILDLHLIHHGRDFAVKTERCGLQSEARLTIQSNPWTGGLNELLLGGYRHASSEIALPEREPRIDEKQERRYFGPKEYLVAMGGAVLLGSVILLFKVLDEIYLNPRFNVNVAVSIFLFSLLLFVLGGWII